MNKFIVALLISMVLSNNAFAVWQCTKVSTENKGETLDITMSCTNGVAAPVVLTRPVFRPERKADVKNAMRNVAIELKDKTNAIAKVSTVQSNVDADPTIIAVETDPLV